MVPERRLHIRSNRENLWIALSRVLGQRFPAAITERGDAEPAPGDVLVITRDSASEQLCRENADRGVRVIVLAPLLRAEQQAAFMAAGALHYLPMDLDLQVLVGAVSEALR
jgi:DNA-binding NarL/FixJ family response regulator